MKRTHLKHFTDPCEPNPCGPGICQITANLLNGYICRCNDGTVQITNCSEAKSPCESSPCGLQGRCLPLAAAPKGYMCICQSGSITFTNLESCPNKPICTDTSCKNGGTCVPYAANEPSCSANQESSTCCQCKFRDFDRREKMDRCFRFRSTEFHWFPM